MLTKELVRELIVLHIAHKKWNDEDDTEAQLLVVYANAVLFGTDPAGIANDTEKVKRGIEEVGEAIAADLEEVKAKVKAALEAEGASGL